MKSPDFLSEAVAICQVQVGFVEVFCQAGYVAKFTLTYDDGGQTIRQEKILPLGQRHRFKIPGGATSINVTGKWVDVGKDHLIFSKGYQHLPNRIITVYGTIFEPKSKGE